MGINTIHNNYNRRAKEKPWVNCILTLKDTVQMMLIEIKYKGRGRKSKTTKLRHSFDYDQNSFIPKEEFWS